MERELCAVDCTSYSFWAKRTWFLCFVAGELWVAVDTNGRIWWNVTYSV